MPCTNAKYLTAPHCVQPQMMATTMTTRTMTTTTTPTNNQKKIKKTDIQRRKERTKRNKIGKRRRRRSKLLQVHVEHSKLILSRRIRIVPSAIFNLKKKKKKNSTEIESEFSHIWNIITFAKRSRSLKVNLTQSSVHFSRMPTVAPSTTNIYKIILFSAIRNVFLAKIQNSLFVMTFSYGISDW